MLIIGHREVRDILKGREREIISLVADAYRLHDEGRSALPHSVFLRFPGDDRNRIIGLPAHLGGQEPVSGMKWIASFPGNVAQGKERASASIVLNSMADGTPEAFIEASLVSAKRTAASAAVAAGLLSTEREPSGISLIGLGPINLEVLRFAKAQLPSLLEVTLFDLDTERAHAFGSKVRKIIPGAAVHYAASAGEAVAAHRLVSLATTAGTPHLDLGAAGPGTTVLHVSLRDLTVESILGAQNVVDDADHVCRERTSLHLAEQATGGREFVDATIGGMLRAPDSFRRDPHRVAVFSPFGLGILDLALAQWVKQQAEEFSIGTKVDDFLPLDVVRSAA
ncbi:2,3-diaminopropionate biosynthesis protein SbnB [Streptomyces lavendulae]|uniref:Alanine dehydrogenase n=1 Tax=Streptomyces lavendulae subsp. lavendulae TaxID=58340 RepID=A0A2K8PBX7_STRLA|nr:2,3-diaminopropionate biosynthesis protein SbnB [Streptomyces lavendulae]ATZ23958.1 alanine dehydrogenase [Streptomyces lavendulae subsp. lavendulae]QUQ53789.1 N-((2S)-2-amino-2-carboxyethyl)-L-glutamate dehydrogenase [Streptomyces lavendulae subsp. lavendulae]